MADFEHRQSAHCESGVAANLLRHHGLDISEPMAFGLSSSLTFAYIPQVKVAGMPLMAYRMPPGHVLSGVGKRVGAKWERRTYSDPARGMDALDAHLDAGRPVGLQTSVYWLPYFPEDMRFHFNAHNLVVYGREGDDYLISDPVFEEPVRCARADLQRARWAKGALASKGLAYHPVQVPAHIDHEHAIPRAIRWNRRLMMFAPFSLVGPSGVRAFAKAVTRFGRDPKWDKRLPALLGHIVRMQEEIGTGGAGFRFLYAAFLQEGSKVLAKPLLREAADALTDAGDEWRLFALQAVKMCRGRSEMDAGLLAKTLNKCADQEEQVWGMLKAV